MVIMSLDYRDKRKETIIVNYSTTKEEYHPSFNSFRSDTANYIKRGPKKSRITIDKRAGVSRRIRNLDIVVEECLKIEFIN
ncbi:hypothetical protein HYW75_07060 [Candidatus Pacearchaeota archaeon]|nr:hypothetical protein [Candidatus Pacearchaeota archaeon]